MITFLRRRADYLYPTNTTLLDGSPRHSSVLFGRLPELHRRCRASEILDQEEPSITLRRYIGKNLGMFHAVRIVSGARSCLVRKRI